MPQFIIQRLQYNDAQAFQDARRLLDQYRHTTSEEWIKYSELFSAYLSKIKFFYSKHNVFDCNEHATSIINYYDFTIKAYAAPSDFFGNSPGNTHTYHNFLSTFSLWKRIPKAIWDALERMHWDVTPLYLWGLKGEQAHMPLGYALIHDVFGPFLLRRMLAKKYAFLDAPVHWHLWCLLYQKIHTAGSNKKKKRDILLLAAQTPSTFEYAITEYYQQEPEMFTAKICKNLLNMDIAQGDPKTTCSATLLLYDRFRYTHPDVFKRIQIQYPPIIIAFDTQLALYQDVNIAILHIDVLMPQWNRYVLLSMHEIEKYISLPENIDFL